MIQADVGLALIDHARGLDLAAHIAAAQPIEVTDPESLSFVDNGIGYVSLQGVLMRQQSSLGMGTSTVVAQRAIRTMAADESVRSIVLLIDSPGGTVSGTVELGQEVARTVAAGKPVYAVVDGMCCSGAYWVASQASEITATPSSKIGSIGVYMVLKDSSEAYAAAGVKVHIVKAGDFKATGEPGTEVTNDQLASIQTNIIDPTYKMFTEVVQRGRRMTREQVASVATGEYWQTAQAIQLGLVDAENDADAVVATIRKGFEMADAEKPRAATLAELKASIPGADNDFLVSQLEAGATVVEAMQSYCRVTAAALVAEKSAREAAEQKAAAVPSLEAVDGLKSSAGKQESDEEPRSELDSLMATFQAYVDVEYSKCRSKSEAYRRVVAKHPSLMIRLADEGTKFRDAKLTNPRQAAAI